eukprot:CAMPEP_0204192710 /NCGR_PEP_ID=MMETSP0361-20130328/61098_1 /ASSEMBLY_ACC=CAM_ASM_000343 /TAXON_ID=268821 /ORGANISM="Scrippsiella Hangoei, Strain SHTV-5" /LENGTH=128 /DNA_ID=CAMNT_0051153825 /DNA_START=453 /DNA_END=836 /DNA_ORIENTATION=+
MALPPEPQQQHPATGNQPGEATSGCLQKRWCAGEELDSRDRLGPAFRRPHHANVEVPCKHRNLCLGPGAQCRGETTGDEAQAPGNAARATLPRRRRLVYGNCGRPEADGRPQPAALPTPAVQRPPAEH